MPLDIYTTDVLVETMESLTRKPSFLLDYFFQTTILFDTEQISFDYEEEDLQLAPFVSPLVAGKAEKAHGFSTKTFKPAYVKPKNEVDLSQPFKRRPGEPIGGRMTAGERRNLHIAELLDIQRNRIDRRMEWMAAMALKTGAITVTGEKYPETEVDFERTAAHTKTLTSGARWGEANVSPFDAVETWMNLIGSACGAAVTDIIMGPSAWSYFKADAKSEKAIDRTLGQNALLDLGFTAGAPNTPQWKGRLGGTVNLWVYNPTYKDSAGATQKMWDDTGVVLVAREAMAGRRLFGAIKDGSAGFRPFEYFPKMWPENDPSVEFVMTQSAPLIVPGRPDATVYVKTR